MTESSLPSLSADPISSRALRLNQLFSGRAKPALCGQHLLSSETLLDALVALYEGCCNPTLKADKNVAIFLDNFKNIIIEIKRLRVTICDFDVKKVIGHGHFGDVRVVREKHTDDVYAMKVLRKSEMMAQQNVAFYEEERDIMAQAASPWITRLHYAFQDPLNLYLVMEFHPGGDLLGMLDRYDSRFSESVARFYLAELVMAINALHQMGYVHRDVKPDNILIDRTGHIKLADFGSAARLTVAGLVISRMPVGTPDYIAPEVLDSLEGQQRHRGGGGYGRSCDWWSLGVVAYEMVYGQTPFSDNEVIKIYSRIMNFATTLEFPDAVNDDGGGVSVVMVDLMRGLLTGSANRLDFERLRHHAFFSSIDWCALRDTHPPFIPVITANDDTSNFEDESGCSLGATSKRCQRLETACLSSTRTGFSSQNLPFVGFTFTQMREVDSAMLQGTTSSATRKSLSNLEDQFRVKKKELLDSQRERNVLEKTVRESRFEVDRLTRRLQDAAEAGLANEHDVERLTRELAQSAADAVSLKKLLELEQVERINTEKNALQLLVDIKEKWKKAEESKVEKLTAENGRMKEFINHQEQQYKSARLESLALRKDLAAAHKSCENTKTKLRQQQEKAKESRRVSLNEIMHSDVQQHQVSNLNEQLERAESTIAELRERLQTTVELEIKVQQLESSERHARDERVEQLNHANLALQEQVNLARNDLAAVRQDLESKRALLDESERNGREMAVELEEQRRQIWDMMQQIGEANSPKVTNLSYRKSAREAKIKSRVQILEGELNEYKDECDRLREQLMQYQESDHEKTQTVDELRTTVERLETGMRRLETSRPTTTNGTPSPAKRMSPSSRVAARIVSPCGGKNEKVINGTMQSAEKIYLEANIFKLEGQLERARETALIDKQALREVRVELFKRERELKDARIDLRIATREAKESAEQLAAMHERKLTLAKGKEESDIKTSEMQRCMTELETKLAEATQLRDAERKDFERQKSRLDDRVAALQANVQELKLAEAGLRESQARAGSAHREIESLAAQLKSVEADKRRLLQQEDKLQREIMEEKRSCTNIQLNFDLLKETIEEMDEQLKAFEGLQADHDEELAEVQSRVDTATRKIDALLEELEDARRCEERERSTARATVAQMNELQQQLDMRELIGETELHSAQAHAQDYRAAVSSLTQEIVQWENRVRAMEGEEAVLRSRDEALTRENASLKNEAAELLDHIQALRNTNFKVSHQLEEALASVQRAKEETAEVEGNMQDAVYLHGIERIKLQETVAQQVKLIDFLQKSAEAAKKKKTLPEKLFGRKDSRAKVPPIIIEHHHYSPPTTPLKKLKPLVASGKDVADGVRRDNCINAAQTQEMLASLALSPGCQQDVQRSSSMVVSRKPSNERMQHNIPHRFQVGLNLHPTKCAACLEGIHFGRYFSRCLECHIAVHDKCASTVAQTCSLPLGLMQHYRQSMRASKKKANGMTETVTLDTCKMEGSLKIPKKGSQGWELRHAKVDGSTFLLFKEESGRREREAACFQLELVSDEAAVRVAENVHPGELSGTAKCDLGFIFKLELQPLTTCWPGRSHYFMVSSVAEKLAWTCALEKIIRKNRPCPIDDELHSVILTFENSPTVDINCVCYLDEDHVLLGAEEGLYYVNQLDENGIHQQPTKLVKDFGPVGHMLYCKALKMVILTAGNKQTLYWIALTDIMAVCRGEVEYATDVVHMMHPIDDISSCHLFVLSPSEAAASNPFLCAATPQKVAIFKWNPGLKVFSMRKTIPVDEPCSCALFTPNSLLVGTDKFYDIELENFFVEDFLDESDSSLMHHVQALPGMKSFPINIFQVSPSGVQEEYLLCFHEFGLFIDSFGQRSRKDVMRWTRLPLSFAFQWPYLYVIHFSSVEVYEIIVHKEKCFSVQTFVDIPSPRLLGLGLESGTIVLATAKENMAKVLLLNGEAAVRRKSEKTNGNELATVAEEASNEDSGDSSNFSFSSSVLQALEQTDLPIDARETEL